MKSFLNALWAAPGLKLLLGYIGVVWIAFIGNFITGGYVNKMLAVYPRQLHGLFGLLGSPFAHANWSHLVSNTVPFVMLAALVLLAVGTRGLLLVLVLGAAGSGLGAWLFSSAGMVVGASGVVFALLGFLLGRAYVQPSVQSWLIAGVSLFLYSGVLFSLLKWLPGVSWTGHFFGLVAGVLVAVYVRQVV